MVLDRLMKFKNIGFAMSSVIPVPLAISDTAYELGTLVNDDIQQNIGGCFH